MCLLILHDHFAMPVLLALKLPLSLLAVIQQIGAESFPCARLCSGCERRISARVRSAVLLGGHNTNEDKNKPHNLPGRDRFYEEK